MAKPRYSSHVLLQYLLRKYQIDPQQLQREVYEHYSHPAYIQRTTDRGRVTQIQIQPGVRAPKIAKSPVTKGTTNHRPTTSQRKQPVVTIKKRRYVPK